jgi:hypothetical protein
MGLHVRRQAHALREHVLEAGLIERVRVREALQPALSPVENRRVAHIAAVEPAALEHDGAQRAGELGGAVALERFLVKLTIDLRGEFGERAPRTPRPGPGKAIVCQRLHGAPSRGTALATCSDAIRQRGDDHAVALADDPRVIARLALLAGQRMAGEVDLHAAMLSRPRCPGECV